MQHNLPALPKPVKGTVLTPERDHSGADFDAELDRELADLNKRGLYRHPDTLSGSQGPYIEISGRKFVNAAANNPLGLATDNRLQGAAREALEVFGTGSGASRLICGQFEIHRQLEESLARFKGTEDAVVFPTGYMANLGTITALVGKGDSIIMDKLSHASLVDGARLSGARLRTYPHCNLEGLRKVLAKEHRQARRILVITDSIFSMDGDLAPLPGICESCAKYGAILMVDEAHATGVLGDNGAGASHMLGLEKEIPVMMGTLSKALGGMGGFIAGSHRLCEVLRNRARPYIYTTALPPVMAATSIRAIEIVQSERERAGAVTQKTAWLYKKLVAEKILLADTPPPAAHILPVLVGENDRALKASATLRENGIFAPAIRPPTVPQNSARIRLSIMSDHSQEDLDAVAAAFVRCRESGQLDLGHARR